MNPALIAATVAMNANKNTEFNRTYYCIPLPYPPKPRPDCAVSVTLKLDSNVSAEPSVINDAIDIRFRNEEGLDELNEFIRKLIKARDSLERGIKGEENND